MLILASEGARTLSAIAELIGATVFRQRFTCITTAAALESERPWVVNEQAELRRLGAEIEELELSTKSPEEALRILSTAQVVFVHGGNTFFLLQEMQRIGFADFLKAYDQRGGLYIGTSAGAIVTGPRIDIISPLDDPEVAPSVNALAGLNLIDIVPIVHFDGPNREEPLAEVFALALRSGVNIVSLRNDQFLRATAGRIELFTAR